MRASPAPPPRRIPTAAVLLHRGPSEGPGGPLAVLVLAELAAPRQLLADRLRRAGHAVVAVGQVAAVLDHLHRAPCDALVASFRPPALGMLGLARTLRALPPPLGRLPIVGLVPTVTQQAMRDCLAAGLDLLLPEAPAADGGEGLPDGLARIVAERWGLGPFDPAARAALAAGLTAEALEARDAAAIRTAGDLAIALRESRQAGSVAEAAGAIADALAAIGARDAVDAARALATAPPERRNALLPPLLSTLVALRVALHRERETRSAARREPD